jgi:hypothetical protein
VAVSIHHGTHQVGVVMVGVIVTCHDELGINTGFQTSTPKPWTKIKQKKALEEKKKKDENDKFNAL